MTKANDLPRPVTARGEATRRKILDAAEVSFGKQGYHNTSIADITKQADVGQGTFYLYFPSKEDVFRELVRDMSYKLRRALAEATEGLEDRLEIERQGLETFVRFCLKHHNLYRIVMQAQFVDEAIYREYYLALADGYVTALTIAQAEGQIRLGDAEAQAWSLMGIAHFLGLRYAIWEQREPNPDVVDEMFRLIKQGLQPQSA